MEDVVKSSALPGGLRAACDSTTVEHVSSRSQPAAAVKRVRCLSAEERVELVEYYRTDRTVYSWQTSTAYTDRPWRNICARAGVRMRLDGMTPEQIRRGQSTL
jgi:aminoglycoside phosphotransferase (APT) family kinase protein